MSIFGEPVTDETLRKMPEYAGKTITRRDRAKVALQLKHDKNKNKQAQDYVSLLKKRWGTGVSTLICFYNATGDTIYFAYDKDWHGHIDDANPYPKRIHNGQWCGFLHVKSSGAASGSMAGCAYRGKNNGDREIYWLIAWSNPWSRISYDNSVYGLLYDSVPNSSHEWNYIEEKLSDTRYSASETLFGCVVKIETESDSSPRVEAIFTLE